MDAQQLQQATIVGGGNPKALLYWRCFFLQT
jgi:threonine/homoserine/homoserine lactone efflux protein